tara:strand:+ start:474 stop:677 length:204 start_codon:yes stop_codon:yes gene_type:complete
MKSFNHLNDADMSYGAHLRQAMRYYVLAQRAALCLFLHALWPDIYTDTASSIINDLSKEFLEKKNTS